MQCVPRHWLLLEVRPPMAVMVPTEWPWVIPPVAVTVPPEWQRVRTPMAVTVPSECQRLRPPMAVTVPSEWQRLRPPMAVTVPHGWYYRWLSRYPQNDNAWEHRCLSRYPNNYAWPPSVPYGSQRVLTPWCRVLLEKLTGLQLVKKFPAFYGTRRFITVLTSVRHLSLSWANPIQSTYPQPTSWRSILILSTHLRLGLAGGLFPSGFPTKTLYAPLSSPIRARCPAHLILLDFITRTILGEEYK